MRKTVRVSIICAVIVIGVALTLFSTSAMSIPQDFNQGDMINSDSSIQGANDGLFSIPMVNQEAEDEYAEEDEEAYEEEGEEEGSEEINEEDAEEGDEEVTEEEVEGQEIDDEESENIEVEEE